MPDKSLTYRIATSDDLNGMALVLERANAVRDEKPIPNAVEDTALNDLSERMSRHGAWVYVAIYQNRIVGFMLGHPYSQGEDMPVDQQETTCHSLWLQRYSQQATRYCCEQCKERG